MFLDNFRSKTTERPAVLEGITLANYEFASRFSQNKSVLDIGTGLGAGANYLATKGAQKVLGIDNNKPAIDYAKTKYTPPNLKFLVMNALDILFQLERFDVITAFEIIEHLPLGSYPKFVAQMKEMLAPKGVCLISTPNKLISSPERTKPLNPYHKKEFTPNELLKLTKKHLPKSTLMGVTCINKTYLENHRTLEKRLGNRLTAFVSRYKITHEFLPLIPKRLRLLATSRNCLPTLTAADFKISRQGVNKCEGLLAVCSK